MPLTASVGAGGANHPKDARYLQYLLVDWRRTNNLPPIAIDGVVGPRTVDAIRNFQQRETRQVDGRVDPNGPTLRRLEECHMGNVFAGIRYSPPVRPWPGAPPPDQRTDSEAEDLFRRYLKELHANL